VTMHQGYQRPRHQGYERPRRRRHRGLAVLIVVLVVLIGLLVGADFWARSYAENRVAAEIQHQGFPTRPTVTIDGFPFLTQVISRDFSEVQISSGSITEGPLVIQSMSATLDRVLVNPHYNGGTVTSLNGNAGITFTALASAMSSEAGALSQLVSGTLSLSAAGSGEVKATLGVDGFGATAVWRVSATAPRTIDIQLVSAGSLPSQLLNGIGTITIKLPALPLGLSLAAINVTPSGLVATVTGQNVNFGS
jgi:hypothetical protein